MKNYTDKEIETMKNNGWSYVANYDEKEFDKKLFYIRHGFYTTKIRGIHNNYLLIKQKKVGMEFAFKKETKIENKTLITRNENNEKWDVLYYFKNDEELNLFLKNNKDVIC